jgi:hypothetical protein
VKKPRTGPLRSAIVAPKLLFYNGPHGKFPRRVKRELILPISELNSAQHGINSADWELLSLALRYQPDQPPARAPTSMKLVI